MHAVRDHAAPETVHLTANTSFRASACLQSEKVGRRGGTGYEAANAHHSTRIGADSAH